MVTVYIWSAAPPCPAALVLNCVQLINGPLTKNRDNFLAIGPFFMFLGAFERHGHAAHYAFNFIKKYLFFEKLEPKTFSCSFFITRFSENIFRENCPIVFSKMWTSRKKSKFEIFSTLKINFPIFFFWKQLDQLFSEK